MLVNSTAIFAALAGTYTLLNTSSWNNGVPVPDETYGDNPVGLLIYTETGYMSATLASTDPEDRPENLTFPAQEGQSDADWALVGKHSIGYAGPVTINDAFPATTESGGVFHGPLHVANVPSMVGALHPRNYTFFENGTLLRLASRRDGGNTGELWWKRVA